MAAPPESGSIISLSTNTLKRKRVPGSADDIFAIEDDGIDPDQSEKQPLVIPVQAPQVTGAPLLLANINPEVRNEKTDQGRLKIDILTKAEDVDFKSSSFKRVPVESFGEALLRGMGWTGPSKDDEEFQKRFSQTIVPRGKGLGLGAEAKPPGIDSKGIIQGPSRPPLEKKSEPVVAFQLGDLVKLNSAQFSGHCGQVIKIENVPGLNKIRIQLEGQPQSIDVPIKDVEFVSQGTLRTEEKNVNRHSSTELSVDASKIQPRPSKETKPSQAAPRTVSSDRSWLFSNIRVRIISKKFQKHYLQKGSVLDVYRNGECSVRMDSGSVVEGLLQRHLETVLPSRGGACLVLSGAHSGKYAHLLEKLKDKDEALVQLDEDLDIISVKMDHIAAI